MEIKRGHWIGIVCSLVIIILSLFLMNTSFFFLVLGIGIIVGVAPFVLSTIVETKAGVEKEAMFLEFSRNLVESVKTGTPISKSIVNMRNKPYGVLSENIKKLANQISLGIPLNTALQIFSKDVNNTNITRALTLIGQAERAGGDIGEILEAVAGSVGMADKLRKERKAAISTLVTQGYIIFFVFIIIILVMQFKILPMVAGISGSEGVLGELGGGTVDAGEISSSFLYLLLIQGFFSGLTIGKLAEGNAKSGVKYSFTLMISAFLVSTISNLIFG